MVARERAREQEMGRGWVLIKIRVACSEKKKRSMPSRPKRRGGYATRDRKTVRGKKETLRRSSSSAAKRGKRKISRSRLGEKKKACAAGKTQRELRCVDARKRRGSPYPLNEMRGRVTEHPRSRPANRTTMRWKKCEKKKSRRRSIASSCAALNSYYVLLSHLRASRGQGSEKIKTLQLQLEEDRSRDAASLRGREKGKGSIR